MYDYRLTTTYGVPGGIRGGVVDSILGGTDRLKRAPSSNWSLRQR